MNISNIAIVLPVLEKNTYSKNGDFTAFGNTSLVQWKLSQLIKVFDKKQIYISSPSMKAETIADKNGVNFLLRSEGLEFKDVVASVALAIESDDIIWTNVTAPFLDQFDFENIWHHWKHKAIGVDSLLTVKNLFSYAFLAGKSINVSSGAMVSRAELTPIQLCTNGLFIVSKKIALEKKSLIGDNPMLFEVDGLSALELKQFTDLDIANQLISSYVAQKLN